MRTRRLAFFVLLSFLWLQLLACAPHEAAAAHNDVLTVSSTHDGHCHHETDSHTHEYVLAPPSRNDSPVTVPATPSVTVHSGRPETVVQNTTSNPRCRSGREVLLESAIART